MRLRQQLGLVTLRLICCAKVEPQFVTEILHRADFAPLLQALRGHGQQCVLLRLLQLRSASALAPNSECHGTFRAMNLVDRKSLVLELSAGYQLRLVNPVLLRGDELDRAQLQLVNAFRVTRFHQQLRR